MTYSQLEAGAKVLEIIDRKRVETGNPGLGSAVERLIIDRCLAELEAPAGNRAIGVGEGGKPYTS